MQIIQEKNELQLNGITEKGEFQFKITPQAMQMFFKDIYKDPILACVRELVCNAFDAHTMNGNADEAFNVHVPTDLEPWFEVRDFGVGLSKEGMETLYSTFFESAKQHTNELIGGLGIGSKSPLAYTDMFTATSYFKGKMYQYLITKNEFGVPTWNFVGEFDTTERNGLSINVPVKATHGKSDYRDIEAFRKAAIKVFTRFSIQPNWTGAKLDIQPVTYSVSYGSWGVRDESNDSKGLVAIMGNIAYPINMDSLRLDNATRHALQGVILDCYSYAMPIDINFKIGELSITPSREELQYDTRTVDAIMAAFKTVQTEFLAETTKKIDSQPTYLAAINHVVSMTSEMRNIVINNKIQYKGKPIEFRFDVDIPTKETEIEIETGVDPQTQQPIKTKQKVNIKQLQLEHIDLDILANYKANNLAFSIGASNRWNVTEQINVDNTELLFIVKDERSGNVIPKVFPVFRDKYWQKNGDRYIGGSNYHRTYTKTYTKRNCIGVVPAMSLTDKKEITKYIESMMAKHGLEKDITIMYLSDLVEDPSLKPVRTTAANAGKTYKFRVLDLNKVFGSEKNMNEIFKMAAGNDKGFEDEDIDVKKTKGVYYTVCSNNSTPNWKGKLITSFEVLVALRAVGIEKVVSVPPQRISKHIKEHWLNLDEKLDKHIVGKKLSKHIKNADTNKSLCWDKIRGDYLSEYRVGCILDFVDTVCAGGVANNPKLHTLKTWMESVEIDIKQNKSNFQTRLAEFFNLDNGIVQPSTDLNRFYEDTKKYGDVRQIIEEVVPMLSLVEIPDQYYWKDIKREKATFVKNLVDRVTK